MSASAPQRSATAPSSFSVPGSMAETIDLEHSIVIGRNECEHLRMLSNELPPPTKEKIKRDMLKEMSQNRYKHWPNTLDAQRKKKSADRMKRLEQIEYAQQVIDRQEEEYKKQQTDQAIHRANKLLYHNNDQVKVLHSSLLLSKVLQERDDQLHMSNYKKNQQDHIDRLYEMSMSEAAEAQAAREKRDEDLRKAQAVENAKAQLAQLQLHRSQFLAERKEEMLEGMRVKQIAQDALEEQREAERQHRQRSKDSKETFQKWLLLQKKLKDDKLKMEAEEDAKLERYVESQDKLNQSRKQHEINKKNAAERRSNDLMKKQHEHLTKLQKAEQERLARLEVERLEKLSDEDKKAAEKKEQLKNMMTVVRRQQIEKHAKQIAYDNAVKQMMQQEWASLSAHLDKEDDLQERKDKENKLRHEEQLLKQINANQERTRAERVQEMYDGHVAQLMSAKDDVIFQEYAQYHLNDSVKRGRSALPIQLALSKLKKKATSFAL